jgi:hypothetical protein
MAIQRLFALAVAATLAAAFGRDSLAALGAKITRTKE